MVPVRLWHFSGEQALEKHPMLKKCYKSSL